MGKATMFVGGKLTIAGRDHRTTCEIALKSAVKKTVFLRSLQAFTPLLPHFFSQAQTLGRIYPEQLTALQAVQKC